MNRFELKVSTINHHFNNKVSFSVVELVSGEALIDDVDSYDEAESEMMKLIVREPNKYYTNMDIEYGHAYSLKRLPFGSERYGNCEVCKAAVSTCYYLVQMRRYYRKSEKKDGVTKHGCFSLFGHKNCLINSTEKAS